MLAFLSSLALALPIFAVSGDWLLSVRVAAFPACVALVIGAWGQLDITRAHIDGRIARAKFVPFRPQSVIDIRPTEQPNNTPHTPQTAPRTIAYNSASGSGQLSLEPASSGLVGFLETCIRISAADKTVFPSVLDLKHIGITYAEYDEYLALLGDAVERPKRRPATIKSGYTLGDLRRFSAGQDLIR